MLEYYFRCLVYANLINDLDNTKSYGQSFVKMTGKIFQKPICQLPEKVTGNYGAGYKV